MAGVIGIRVDARKQAWPKEPMLQITPKTPIRRIIENLEPNGIGVVSDTALHDPDVIALWFGESDLTTPDFIRDGARRALDGGKTFYTNTRGITPLREAILTFPPTT